MDICSSLFASTGLFASTRRVGGSSPLRSAACLPTPHARAPC